MTGEEALGRGAWDAGVALAVGYPGAPVTRVLTTVMELAEGQQGECYATWTVNERVAADLAIGASLTGRRALFVTKSVGFNTVIDELHLVNLTGVEGGLVITLGDDPKAVGSQNNQDTRLLARALELPILEPRNPAEGYACMIRAFELSEQLSIPVVVRIVQDFSAMSQDVRANVTRRTVLRSGYPGQARHRLSAPALVEERHRRLHVAVGEASLAFDTWPGNVISGPGGSGEHNKGLLTVGQCGEKLAELEPEYCNLSRFSWLQLSTSFPMPENLLAEFCGVLDTVLVLEEGESFVESQLRELAQRRGWRLQILGRETGTVPDRAAITGAAVQDAIRSCAADAWVGMRRLPEPPPPVRLSEFPFEENCPFYSVFRVLRECLDETAGAKPWLIGEPGCNVRLTLPPFELFDYRVAMGSSTGVGAGMNIIETGRRTVAIVGDSAFVHSGLPALADAATKGWKVLILIMDNKVLGVTGCQPGPTAGATGVDLVALCRACGVPHVEKVSTREPDCLRQIFRSSLAANDLRVLVLEYPCSLCRDALKA